MPLLKKLANHLPRRRMSRLVSETEQPENYAIHLSLPRNVHALDGVITPH